EPLFVLKEVPVQLGGEIRPGEFEPRGLDVKTAITRADAQHSRRQRPAFRVRFECPLDGGGTFVETEQRGHVPATEQQCSFLPHTPAPCLPVERRPLRFDPGSISTGPMPRRKIRAALIPFRMMESPSTRSIVPSRRPTTVASFSSRNWLIRSSCVSPICVESGSGS